MAVTLSCTFSACDRDLDHALDMAGDNRGELEKVLEHFKKDPDRLKYEAAKFLICNMPYHYSYSGETIEKYDSAYMVMAGEPIQFRDSVFKELTGMLDFSRNNPLSDAQQLNANQLIKIIDDACDTWRATSWHQDFPTDIFFDYVLPYRILNEQISDWHSTINQQYPYLASSTIKSTRGVVYEAGKGSASMASIVRAESASSGNMKLLSDCGSSVSFHINTPLGCKKYLILRYTCINKGGYVNILLNGKTVHKMNLEPTNNMCFFRNTRVGIDIELPEGKNYISVHYGNTKVGLDYISLSSVESSNDIATEDFSKSYYRIANKSTGKYISFDTTAVLKKTSLKRLADDNMIYNLRLDYHGNKCWSINETSRDSASLCIEVQCCLTHENADVGQFTFINGNHQKWVLLPTGDGCYRIMGKDSGLSIESVIDNNGEEHMILSTYAGKDSQKWNLIPVKPRNIYSPVFAPGSSIDKATKVFDVTNLYEWIGFGGRIMPVGSSLLKGCTGNCREEAAFTVFLCRYLGIPAAVDFTPHWANRSQSHLWSVLIKPDGKSVPFYMGNAPGDTIHYFHPYLKPKVFRHRFRLNRDIVNDLRQEKDIPSLFKSPDFIDVTDEYYTTSNVSRNVPDEVKQSSVAYICVFDNRNWVPVDYGKISNGEVTFKSMVRNIVYIAATFRNGRIVTFGNPFLIDRDGAVKKVVASRNQKQNMIIRNYKTNYNINTRHDSYAYKAK